MAARMNWFEGGRRITRLLQWLVGLGAGAIALFSTPYTVLTFQTTGPDRPWILSRESCRYGQDGAEDFPRDFGVGESSTTLCFRAARFDDEMMIPYKLGERDTWYGAKEFSDLAQTYMKGRVETFSVSQEVREEARRDVNRQWWKQWKKNLRDAIIWGFGIIVAIEALSWVVGWIVRGFAGVPTGKDHRVSKEEVE